MGDSTSYNYNWRKMNKIGIVKGEFIYKEIRELLLDHLVNIQ